MVDDCGDALEMEDDWGEALAVLGDCAEVDVACVCEDDATVVDDCAACGCASKLNICANSQCIIKP